MIEKAPKRPSGKIKVKLIYKGRSKPIPVLSPKEEECACNKISPRG